MLTDKSKVIKLPHRVTIINQLFRGMTGAIGFNSLPVYYRPPIPFDLLIDNTNKKFIHINMAV